MPTIPPLPFQAYPKQPLRTQCHASIRRQPTPISLPSLPQITPSVKNLRHFSAKSKPLENLYSIKHKGLNPKIDREQIAKGVKISPKMALNILYEDKSIVVADKPAGMVVHPGPGHETGTLFNVLLSHINLSENGAEGPFLAHRLDKDTTGVIIVGKTLEIQQILVEQFKNRTVEKVYMAICTGNPGNREIKNSLGRDPKDRQKMAVLPFGGKTAVTRCETLAQTRQLSLVKLLPLTGRQHQLRVHMHHIGHSILGDPDYGNERINDKFDVQRPLLHAYNLTLHHPLTKEKISFKSKLPGDFLEVLETHFPKSPPWDKL